MSKVIAFVIWFRKGGVGELVKSNLWGSMKINNKNNFKKAEQFLISKLSNYDTSRLVAGDVIDGDIFVEVSPLPDLN